MGDLVEPTLGQPGWNVQFAALIAWYNANGDELPARVAALESGLYVTSATRTTAYTLTANDVSVEQVYSSASGAAITVPTDATASIPVGAAIPLRQSGTGTLSVAAAGGVTVNSRGGALALAGQHAVAEVRKTAANTWVLYGDIA